MAHLKCPACQARVWREGDPAHHVRDLCPACAGPLEPVGRAEEVLGLRALRSRPRQRPRQSVADQIRDTIARNDAARVARLRRKDGDDGPAGT